MVVRLRPAVGAIVAAGGRPLLLGGCCALVMGAVAGARDAAGRVGVVNVDGHIDAYDGADLADRRGGRHPGRGAARARRRRPARRDGPGARGPARRRASCSARATRTRPPTWATCRSGWASWCATAPRCVADPDGGRASRPSSSSRRPGIGYWLHLDVDVLGEDVFPATDYLMPGGLDLAELAAVLGPLGADAGLLGLLGRLLQPVQGPGRRVRRRARRRAGRRAGPGAVSASAAERDGDVERAFAANVLGTLALTIARPYGRRAPAGWRATARTRRPRW